MYSLNFLLRDLILSTTLELPRIIMNSQKYMKFGSNIYLFGSWQCVPDTTLSDEVGQ